MSEVVYEYDSKIGGFLNTTMTIDDEFYLRPRRVDAIARVTLGTGDSFGPTS